MNFNEFDFVIFFSVVIITLVIIKNKKYEYLFLLIASYYFYFTFNNYYIFLLIYISLISYYSGKYIYIIDGEKKKRLFLWIGIISSILVLIYFKYTNFIIENSINLFQLNISFKLTDIILPIGISFYTFSGLTYIFDIYYKKIKPADSFYKYALFISFFPHLLAGPIVRASQFLPQLEQKIIIDPFNIKVGVTTIFFGLIKKFILADNIAPIINVDLSNPIGLSSFAIMKLTFLFGLQIYFDFSGYCDIAIGLARIMGLHLPENFDKPYFATSPTQFWRKWNITLSSFIRDYIYIPLGGNRKGEIRTSINSLFSMFLCGLWHGAAWNFAIWGIYHGVLLNIHKLFIKINMNPKYIVNYSLNNNIMKIAITQYFIFLGWLIFRIRDNNALVYSIKRYVIFDFNLNASELYVIILIITSFILVLIFLKFEKTKNILQSIFLKDWILFFANLKNSYWFYFIIISCLIYLIFLPEKSPEFIYFQF